MSEAGFEEKFVTGRDLADESCFCDVKDCYVPRSVTVSKITTQAVYDQIAAELITRAAEIETAKRPDYTVGDVDVLKNFKACAADAGITAEQAWIIYAKKHWDAIRMIMREPNRKYSEPPRERFADLLNYLKLGYALWRERGT